MTYRPTFHQARLMLLETLYSNRRHRLFSKSYKIYVGDTGAVTGPIDCGLGSSPLLITSLRKEGFMHST